jgi:hypothetical protein
LKKSGQYLDNKQIQGETSYSHVSQYSLINIRVRYRLVYPATSYEYNFFMKHEGVVTWNEPVIRMSGLPFACTMADVQLFFDGK